MVSRFSQRRIHHSVAIQQETRGPDSIGRFSRTNRRTLQIGTRENLTMVKASRTIEDLTISHYHQGPSGAIVPSKDKVYTWTRSKSWTWIRKSLKWRRCQWGGKSQVLNTSLKILLKRNTSIVHRGEMELSVPSMKTLVVAHLRRKALRVASKTQPPARTSDE